MCMICYNADGVLGPVIPVFPPGAPNWLKKSGLCNRPRNVTGSLIQGKDKRTGNALFKKHIFENETLWFDPKRRLTGGSDGEFIGRQMKNGYKFLWCNEAIVYENVPEDRWSSEYYLKRHFRIGTIASQVVRKKNKMLILKNILYLIIYAILFCFSIIFGKHVWIKSLVKICYNTGCILAFFKFVEIEVKQQ